MDGTVRKVILDEIGATGSAPAQWNLLGLLDRDSQDKGRRFIHAVEEHGGALGWELATVAAGRFEMLHYSGVLQKDGMVVLAARAPDQIFHLYGELHGIFNEQAGELRRLQQNPATDEALLEEFMRVNNDLVNVRRELTHKNVQLENLLEELRKAQKIRDDVERITRHDLKGPLNPIINLPELLMESGEFTEEQQSLLQMIRDAGYRMLQMINTSLELYKMETGAYQLRPERVDLPTLLERVVQDCVARMQSVGQGVDIRFAHEGLRTGRVRVLGEELLCHTLLSNLLGNALDASPSGGEVLVEVDREADEAVVRIHNQGAVPEDVRERFFDKYATSGKQHGTGLGTYSAMLMARTQGGTIEMATSESEGTTVTVTLPLAL